MVSDPPEFRIWHIVLTIYHSSAIVRIVDFSSGDFIWDIEKEQASIRKHGIDFVAAAQAFTDAHRKIYADPGHSATEPRLFCIGKVGERIMTVRFVWRHGKIRIFGAGYWRKGAKCYAQED